MLFFQVKRNNKISHYLDEKEKYVEFHCGEILSLVWNGGRVITNQIRWADRDENFLAISCRLLQIYNIARSVT